MKELLGTTFPLQSSGIPSTRVPMTSKDLWSSRGGCLGNSQGHSLKLHRAQKVLLCCKAAGKCSHKYLSHKALHLALSGCSSCCLQDWERAELPQPEDKVAFDPTAPLSAGSSHECLPGHFWKRIPTAQTPLSCLSILPVAWENFIPQHRQCFTTRSLWTNPWAWSSSPGLENTTQESQAETCGLRSSWGIAPYSEHREEGGMGSCAGTGATLQTGLRSQPWLLYQGSPWLGRSGIAQQSGHRRCGTSLADQAFSQGRWRKAHQVGGLWAEWVSQPSVGLKVPDVWTTCQLHTWSATALPGDPLSLTYHITRAATDIPHNLLWFQQAEGIGKSPESWNSWHRLTLRRGENRLPNYLLGAKETWAWH